MKKLTARFGIESINNEAQQRENREFMEALRVIAREEAVRAFADFDRRERQRLENLEGAD